MRDLPGLILFLAAMFLAVGCGDDVKSKGKASSNSGNNTSSNNTSSNNTSSNNTSANIDPMMCGNGALDPGELCDSGIASGPGSCPNSCAPTSACEVVSVTGTAATCTSTCTVTQILSCQGGDGCCPAGCDNSADSDCSATCGNGMVDPGESCDGNCPTSCNDNNSCTTDRLVGSADNCTASCSSSPVTACQGGDGCCPGGCNANTDSDCGGMCGNSQVEPGETCDGNCPTSCVDTNACTADAISGSPSMCNVTCSNTPITSCQSGDGCCPNGCSYPTDLDCSCAPATCGGAGRECGNPSDGCGGTLSCGGCAVGFSCSNFTCVSTGGTSGIGDSCTRDANCPAGGYCGLNPNFKDGYCSKSCMLDNDCPGGSHCGNKSNGMGECLENCASDSDCRSGYECWNYDGDQSPISECAPSGVGSGNVGDSCAGVWQCSGGTAASCLTNSTQTASYCTVPCDGFINLCPTGSVCDGSLIVGGNCVDECSTSAPGCRAGFTCSAIQNPLTGTTNYGCVPN